MFNLTFSVFWTLTNNQHQYCNKSISPNKNQTIVQCWWRNYGIRGGPVPGEASVGLPECLGRRPSLLPSPACSSPPCWPASLEQIQSLQKSVAMNLYLGGKIWKAKTKCVTCCQERDIQWRCKVGFEPLQRWPRMPRSSFSRLAAEPWEREIDFC